jgi:hypothetical protein
MAGLCVGAAQTTGTTAQTGQSSTQQAETTAQKTGTPTLEGILQRLEENLEQYNALVPSFFCDEHVVSKKSPDRQFESRVTDSTFRLKRVANPDPDGKPILEESREVKRVNGQPANGQTLSGPTTVRGAFSGGLALVSLNQQACMSYKLLPIKRNHPKDAYIVQFASVAASERPDDCLLQEDSSGRVLIDPATMQIKRMELHAPHHLIVPGGRTSAGGVIPQVVGVWDLAIDYAPVLLGGHSFWLPSTIKVKMSGSPDGMLIANRNVNESLDVDPFQTDWSLFVDYSNYHRLEVTSRIVPFSGAAAQ